jgi:acetyl esterase
MRRTLRVLLPLVAAAALGAQPPVKPDQVHAYKRLGADSLVVHIFRPAGSTTNRAAVALFHGGGFVWGGPEITDPGARAFAAQGLVAFSFQYRLADRKSITPLDQVADTYDAMRWIRSHAAEYGVDPKRVAAEGTSAGGALIGMAAGHDDESVRPNALVMWSPGVGSATDEDPYITSLLIGRGKPNDVSPYMHVRSSMPPTIIISGQLDSVVWDGLARRYCDKIKAMRSRCDLHSYPNLGHILSRKLDMASQLRGSFDFDEAATKDAGAKVTEFLKSIGFIERK